MATTLQAIQADITTLNVDAIVNAANETLLPGGGVCGAIHRAAGPELLNECRLLGGCRTGDAKLTKGISSPRPLHPFTPSGLCGMAASEVNRSCSPPAIEAPWRLPTTEGITTLAFPSISTGIYGYPFHEAARIAITTTREFAGTPTGLREVMFCCFSEGDFRAYGSLLEDAKHLR